MNIPELYPSDEFPDNEREPMSHESTRAPLLLVATNIRAMFDMPPTQIPEIERYYTVKAF